VLQEPGRRRSPARLSAAPERPSRGSSAWTLLGEAHNVSLPRVNGCEDWEGEWREQARRPDRPAQRRPCTAPPSLRRSGQRARPAPRAFEVVLTQGCTAGDGFDSA